MPRVLLVAVLIMVWFLGAVSLHSYTQEPSMTIGFVSHPTIGWTHFDDDGNLVSVTGFNLGLGYSARYFTARDGLQPNRFNNYWGWGTVLLILPYLELGWLYPIPIGESQYFVFDLGAIYIIPYIGVGFYF